MEMVQCDRCNLWHHFTCVQVTQEIENVQWSCAKCTTGAIQRPASTKLRASNRRQREIALVILEEKRQLAEKRAAEEKATRDIRDAEEKGSSRKA